MRGRTNASNGGIFLNATTDDFEVASGNSIVAGDFVEYHYDTATKIIEASTMYNRIFTVDLSANLFVTVLSGYISLISYIDGVITIVDSYNSSQATTPVFQYNATTFIDSDGNVYVVDISNQTIDYSKNIGGTYKYKVGNYYVTYTFNYVSSNNHTITIKSYDCTDLDNITLVDTKDVTLTSISDDPRFSTFEGYSVYDSGIGFFFTLAVSSSSPKSVRCFRIMADISSSGIITATYTSLAYNTGSTLPANNLNIFNDSALGGRYIPYYYKVASNSAYQLYDVVSGNSISSSITNNTSDSIQTNDAVYFFLSGQLYKIVKATNTLYTLDTAQNERKAPIKNNIFISHIVSNSKVNYSSEYIINDEVVEGTLTDTVQSWSGGLNPMGVAKQSGTAGDTIAVYIPAVNS